MTATQRVSLNRMSVPPQYFQNRFSQGAALLSIAVQHLARRFESEATGYTGAARWDGRGSMILCNCEQNICKGLPDYLLSSANSAERSRV
jgi:hypothetical protein